MPAVGEDMNAVIKFSAVGLLVAVAFSAGSAVSQRATPNGNRGVKGEVLAVIDLGKEIECLAGRQLRMRQVTIEAGGYAGLHDHRNRPTVVYVRAGVITDYPGGGDEAKEYAAGQALVEGAGGLPHWVENKGATPAVLIGVDIFKPQ